MAGDLLADATVVAGEALTEATAPEAECALASLAQAGEDTNAVDTLLEKFETTIHSYLDQLFADGAAPTLPAVSGVHAATGTTAAAGAQSVADTAAPRERTAPGRWGGKTAADHVQEEGNAIGRAPGKPTKRPIREVRSVEELDELFKSLSAGGQELDDPSYTGSLVLLPDGTRIGYRLKSRSSPDPTIDIRRPDRRMLKVHVNRQGWD